MAVGRITKGHPRMHKGRSTVPTILLGRAAHGMPQRPISTMAIARRHRLWHATIVVLGRTMRGCRVRTFRGNTAASAMW